MSALKASCQEPAERPFSLEISRAELVALVKFHCAQAKAVARRFGKAALELRAQTLFGGRALKELSDMAREQQQYHMARAKGLAALLEERS